MSVAEEVRDRVHNAPTDLITLREFRDLPAGAVSSELRRLVSRGQLQHPRRGVYIRSDEADISPYELLYGLARGQVYPVAETAAHLLGLRQIPPSIAQYATTQSEVFALPAPQVRLMHRKPRKRAGLEPLEAGFLDILGRLEHLVPEIEHDKLISRLVEWLGPEDRAHRIAAALEAEPPRTQARAAALLGWAGHTTPTHVQPRVAQLGPLQPQMRLQF